MVDRRDFFRGAAVVGGSAALGWTLLSCSSTESTVSNASGVTTGDSGVVSPSLDDLARGRDQWARMPGAFNRKVVTEADDLALTVLEGELPTDLAGHVFIQSLALGPDDAGLSGDPLIWRVDFDQQQPRISSKLLRSTDYLLAQAFHGTPHQFESRGMMRIGPLGLQNQPNTAFVQMDGNRLFATVDGGRPWEFDPKTLNPITPLGRLDEYRPMSEPTTQNNALCPMTITSAHPPYDRETGEYYGVALSIIGLPDMSFLEVLCWTGNGDIKRVPIVTTDGQPLLITQNAHQMCVTKHHLIIMDAAGTIEPGKLSNHPNSEAAGVFLAPRSDSYLYIINRDELRKSSGSVVAQHAIIPREAGHFMVDYNSTSSQLVIHVPHTSASDFAEWIQPYDVHPESGEPVRTDLVNAITPVCYDAGVIGRYEVDAMTGNVLDATIFHSDWTWGSGGLTTRNPNTPNGTLGDLYHANSGFPTDLAVERVYSGFDGYPHRRIEADKLPWEGIPASLTRVDHDAGKVVDGYWFPGNRFAWTPTFVPRNATATGSDDGYIVVVVFSDEITAESAGTELWVFDAAMLSVGPVAKLGNTDLHVPLTLHSVWLDSLVSSRPDYFVDVENELMQRADTWSDDPVVAATVRSEVISEYVDLIS